MHCQDRRVEESDPKNERPQDLLALDALTFEVGYALLTLIDPPRVASCPARITSAPSGREDMASCCPRCTCATTFVSTPTSTRRTARVELARGKAWMDRQLCLNPSGGAPHHRRIEAKDPAFGLPAGLGAARAAL